MGDSSENLKRKHTLWRGRVDRIPDRSEVNAAFLQVLDHLQQVADGASEAIHPNEDKYIAGGQFAEQPCQNRPGP